MKIWQKLSLLGIPASLAFECEDVDDQPVVCDPACEGGGLGFGVGDF